MSELFVVRIILSNGTVIIIHSPVGCPVPAVPSRHIEDESILQKNIHGKKFISQTNLKCWKLKLISSLVWPYDPLLAWIYDWLSISIHKGIDWYIPYFVEKDDIDSAIYTWDHDQIFRLVLYWNLNRIMFIYGKGLILG